MNAASVRSRVRAELVDEIKEAARRQLAVDGAAALSLRAVAREMGMVSSAVYRYFPSRDDLLTALIVDAYNAMGERVEEAESAVRRTDFRGRWMAVCHAVRDWAGTSPHEYGLVFGTPVPKYAAPVDTITPALRVTVVLVQIVADAVRAGALVPGREPIPKAVRADLAPIRTFFRPPPWPRCSRGRAACGSIWWFLRWAWPAPSVTSSCLRHSRCFSTPGSSAPRACCC